MNDEQLVRGAYSRYNLNLRIAIANGNWDQFASLLRDHIEKVRLVREEIAEVNTPCGTWRKEEVRERIVQRLESAEDELLKDMNRDFVDKYLKGVK